MATTARRFPATAERLRGHGCEVLVLPEQDGRASLAALLDELGRRRMTNLLVEGGGGVLGSFRDAGEIDEVHVFIAAKLAGGAGATDAGGRPGRRDDRRRPCRWRSGDVECIEGDVYIHGWRDSL